MNDKCFCHLNGYAVKDGTARNEIEAIKETYATKTYVDGVITGGLDLDNYATKEYVDNSIQDIEIPTTDLSAYATIDYVNEKTSGDVTLFNDTNGTNSTITLPESINNFSYIEIYYADGNGYRSSMKTLATQGRTYLSTQNIFKAEVSEICNSALIELNDTTLRFVCNYSATHGGTKLTTGDGTIKIYRVVGVK